MTKYQTKLVYIIYSFLSILLYSNNLIAEEKPIHSIRIILPVTQYSAWLDQEIADISIGGIEYTIFFNENILIEASTSSIITVCIDVPGQMTSIRGGYRIGSVKSSPQKLINSSLAGLAGYRMSTHKECDDGHRRKTRAHSLIVGAAYDLHIGRGERRFNIRPHVFFDQAFRSQRVGRGSTDTTFTSPIFKRSVTIGFSTGISF
jgi:hypothetical protein